MRWLLFALVTGCATPPPPVAPAPAVVVEPTSPDPVLRPQPSPSVPDEVSAPRDYVEMTIASVVETTGGFAIALTDAKRTVMVPIFVGGTEALSIDLRHGKRRFSRPLTHDLLDAVTRELGGELVRVQVDAIVDEIFIGSIYLRHDGEIIELDARPSDAIALALGNEVPIYVRRSVIDEAGIPAPPQGLPTDGGST